MKINKRDLFYIIISICALVRMGLYGFAFYPILDDWVQYGTFSLEPNPIRDKFIATGYWTYRPLSWLLDIFLWCRISFLLPLIITLMHAGSCILFLRAGEKIGFKLGIPFILIYMFIPMNSEATMWMSASTRIIVPLFFLSLSLNFAIKLAEFVGAPTGRPRRKVRKFSDGQWPPLRVTYSILFFITQLFALFIYEQVAVITAVITFLLGLKLKRKTIWITTLVTSILLGAYYLAFMPAGPAIERAAVAGNQFWDFYYAFCEGLGRVSWEIFANGFARGIKVLMANPFYFILVALSSLAFGLFSVFKNDDDVKPKKRRGRPRKFSRAKLLFDKHKMPIAKILLGIVLFILTLLPFIFIKGNSLA
ncbi:MAG: hypothetical protein FWE47_02160, partial [Oscillospiraceae bacterium]|nr:hypothetical protein [Oscillospiraceae bacterium]